MIQEIHSSLPRVKIVRITINPHPISERHEIATVGDLQSVVPAGAYNADELVAFIPHGAILPHWLIIKLGLLERLSGKQKNCVREINIQQIKSHGLVYRLDDDGDHIVIARHLPNRRMEGLIVHEGDDVTDFLQITYAATHTAC